MGRLKKIKNKVDKRLKKIVIKKKVNRLALRIQTFWRMYITRK